MFMTRNLKVYSFNTLDSSKVLTLATFSLSFQERTDADGLNSSLSHNLASKLDLKIFGDLITDAFIRELIFPVRVSSAAILLEIYSLVKFRLSISTIGRAGVLVFFFFFYHLLLLSILKFTFL